MKLRSLAAALLAASAFAAPAGALTDPERVWDHKDWRSAFQAGQCAISAGGDGAGRFEISFDMGGFNASARYLPIVYSSMPMPLKPDDEYEILINGAVSDFGSEFWFYDGDDGYGRYMVGASLTGGFTPDLIEAFRRGDHVAIRVMRVGEQPFIIDEFSLSGFTANYLKVSEWCHFDPNNLFRS